MTKKQTNDIVDNLSKKKIKDIIFQLTNRLEKALDLIEKYKVFIDKYVEKVTKN